MDYPTKYYTCAYCGQRYADSDGGCACRDDLFYCTSCQTFYPQEEPTHLRRERLSDGTVNARTVCAACAICEDCQDVPGTVREARGTGTVWICVQCANREG